MPKIKNIAKDSDAGRVRSRMIDDLTKLVSSMQNERDIYGHLFTGDEKKCLHAIITTADLLRQVMDINEETRMILVRRAAEAIE